MIQFCKKASFCMLISSLFFSVNLYSMQKSAEHYLQTFYAKSYPEASSWENTLPNEFKTVTPQAMLHFRAIKKIIGLLKAVEAAFGQGEIFHFEGPLPGYSQTIQGLMLDTFDGGLCSLHTPWGIIKFDSNRVTDIGSHYLFNFVSAKVESCYYCSFDESFEQLHKILAVDGEKLPEPVENKLPWLSLYCEGQRLFTPKVWTDMEKICQSNMRAAQRILCSALHPRVGVQSPLKELGPGPIKHIAHFGDSDHFAYLPEEFMNSKSESTTSPKAIATQQIKRPAEETISPQPFKRQHQ